MTCRSPWGRVDRCRPVILGEAWSVDVRHGVVRQVDEELGEASLGRGIVPENSREGCIAQGLGKALAERFPCSGIVTEAAPD